ncbi:hypothetical protein [Desulfovibrio intestinalis]|uniref:Uncharacterized protein n=1 Tax=Desulfovibrio intestinalis TaxID=58621 RepID=A0A7W8C3T0_9BACT|nr:hypothetical protein [Desulfovibrio intestinalis]MBB5144283.1 hypothetical protein [Desulfovibrio intestinalis]
MRLPFCTHATQNGGSRSLSAPACQLARTAGSPAIFDLTVRNTAAAAAPFFHPTRSTATIERQLTG